MIGSVVMAPSTARRRAAPFPTLGRPAPVVEARRLAPDRRPPGLRAAFAGRFGACAPRNRPVPVLTAMRKSSLNPVSDRALNFCV
jgi:hypothetical protein